MGYETIILEKDDGVAKLTLNRPRKYNAVDTTMMRELQPSLQELSQDDEVKVLTITGARSAFCSGADVATMQGMLEDGSGEEIPRRDKLRLIEPFYSIVRIASTPFGAMCYWYPFSLRYCPYWARLENATAA